MDQEDVPLVDDVEADLFEVRLTCFDLCEVRLLFLTFPAGTFARVGTFAAGTFAHFGTFNVDVAFVEAFPAGTFARVGTFAAGTFARVSVFAVDVAFVEAFPAGTFARVGTFAAGTFACVGFLLLMLLLLTFPFLARQAL